MTNGVLELPSADGFWATVWGTKTTPNTMDGSNISKMMNRVGTADAFQTHSRRRGAGIDGNTFLLDCLKKQISGV
jgi:hypothetical protein